MSWYQQADAKPVGRYYRGGSVHTPMPNPGRICLHTAVSSADTLFPQFNRDGNPVAHFYVRQDGSCEQYVGTRVRASANLEGNYDMIAIESWDNGGKRETWTDAQVTGIAHLLVWLHNRHDIPLVQLDDSKPGRRGVGWHRLGIDGNFTHKPGTLLGGRVPNGEKWSESFGKACPFDGKILGIVNDILPMARRLKRQAEEKGKST